MESSASSDSSSSFYSELERARTQTRTLNHWDYITALRPQQPTGNWQAAVAICRNSCEEQEMGRAESRQSWAELGYLLFTSLVDRKWKKTTTTTTAETSIEMWARVTTSCCQNEARGRSNEGQSIQLGPRPRDDAFSTGNILRVGQVSLRGSVGCIPRTRIWRGPLAIVEYIQAVNKKCITFRGLQESLGAMRTSTVRRCITVSTSGILPQTDGKVLEFLDRVLAVRAVQDYSGHSVVRYKSQWVTRTSSSSSSSAAAAAAGSSSDCSTSSRNSGKIQHIQSWMLKACSLLLPDGEYKWCWLDLIHNMHVMLIRLLCRWCN